MKRDGGLPSIVLAQSGSFADLFAIQPRSGHGHIAAQRQEPEPTKESASFALVSDAHCILVGGHGSDHHRLRPMFTHETFRRTIAATQVVVEVDEERRIKKEHQAADCFRCACNFREVSSSSAVTAVLPWPNSASSDSRAAPIVSAGS